MKQLKKPSVSAAVFAFGGLATMLLRFWLLGSGVDDRGLLVTGHLGYILSYVLCLALPVSLQLLLGRGKHPLHFAPTIFAAVGFFVQAVGFGIAAWTLLSYTTLVMRTATGIFGIIAAFCALVAGIYAMKGYRTHPLFFCPGTLFFACFLFCRYQQWSAEPELQRYVFQLLAAVFSMISLFQRSALGARMGSGKRYVLWSRSTILFCLAAIPGSQLPLLWLTMAASFALDGCEEMAP
jgi:hypothetical protein